MRLSFKVEIYSFKSIWNEVGKGIICAKYKNNEKFYVQYFVGIMGSIEGSISPLNDNLTVNESKNFL